MTSFYPRPFRAKPLAIFLAGFSLPQLFPAGLLPAQTFVWTGASSNSWNTPTNWSPNGVPSSTTDASFSINASPTSGAARDLTNSATLTVGPQSTLIVYQTVNNSGTIALTGSSSNPASFNLYATPTYPTVTLTGGGTISLSQRDYSTITFQGDTYSNRALINVNNTIRGTGTISLPFYMLVNQATISADIASRSLRIVSSTILPVITNTGILEARNRGTLQFNTVSINNASGTVQAFDQSTVSFVGGLITGGNITAHSGSIINIAGSLSNVTLSTDGTGTIRYPSNSQTFSDITNTGTLQCLGSGTSLTFAHSLTNTGTIAALSSSSDTINFKPTASNQSFLLAGNGSIQLTNTNVLINGPSSSFTNITFVNDNNTISGSGTITTYGTATTITNRATLQADRAGESLKVYQDLNTPPLRNEGIIQATSGGIFTFSGTVTNTGTIKALDSGTISIKSIAGGTLQTFGSGRIGATPTLPLILTGNIRNEGTLTATGTASTGTATLYINATANNQTSTLSGSGTLLLSDQTYSALNLNSTAYTGTALINLDNTIRGTGSISLTGSTFIHQGIIAADIDGKTLTVSIYPSGLLVNQGALQASNGGTLSFFGTLDNTAQIIKAASNSNISIAGSLTGGTLTTEGTGLINFIGTSTIKSASFSGNIAIYPSLYSNTTIQSSLSNSGTLTLGSASTLTFTPLANNQTINLTGGGVISLANTSKLAFTSPNGSINRTVINADNLITGAGTISSSSQIFINQSTISANLPGKTLSFSGSTLTNTGTLQATGGAVLALNGNITNTGGTVQALSGSTVFLNGLLIGGTVSNTNTGSVRLGGTLSSVTVIGNAFSTYTTVRNALINQGIITLAAAGNAYSAVFDVDLENGPSSASLTGGGTIVLDKATASKLNVLGPLTGSASFTNTNNLIRGKGSLTVSGNADVQFINKGTISADVPDNTLSLAYGMYAGGNFQNKGLIQATQNGILLIDARLNNTGGTVQAENGGTVQFTTHASDYSGKEFNGGQWNATTGGKLISSSSYGFQSWSHASLELNGPSSAALNAAGQDLFASLQSIETNGSLTFTDHQQSFPNLTSLNGQLTVGPTGNVSINRRIEGAGSITISPTGILNSSLFRINQISVAGTVHATTLLPGVNTSRVNVLSSLDIANDGGPLGARTYSGLLDIANTDLILRQGNEAEVSDMIRAWWNNGTHATVGLGSLLATSNPLTTLAVITNGDPIGGPNFYFFDSEEVDPGDVLVKYTYLGDTDLNGFVDAADTANLIRGIRLGLTGWANGDTNYDNVVDASDLANLLLTFHYQGPALGIPPYPANTSIPEPTTLAILTPLLLHTLSQRTRRTTRAQRQLK